MFFTYSQESKKEERQSGRKYACPAPYTPRKQIIFWKVYVILHWAVPSLMTFSQLLEFLTLYSYLMITGTLLFVASFNGLAFSILSPPSSIILCITWALLPAKEWTWLDPKPITIEIPESPRRVAAGQVKAVTLPGSSKPPPPSPGDWQDLIF